METLSGLSGLATDPTKTFSALGSTLGSLKRPSSWWPPSSWRSEASTNDPGSSPRSTNIPPRSFTTNKNSFQTRPSSSFPAASGDPFGDLSTMPPSYPFTSSEKSSNIPNPVTERQGFGSSKGSNTIEDPATVVHPENSLDQNKTDSGPARLASLSIAEMPPSQTVTLFASDYRKELLSKHPLTNANLQKLREESSAGFDVDAGIDWSPWICELIAEKWNDDRMKERTAPYIQALTSQDAPAHSIPNSNWKSSALEPCETKSALDAFSEYRAAGSWMNSLKNQSSWGPHDIRRVVLPMTLAEFKGEPFKFIPTELSNSAGNFMKFAFSKMSESDAKSKWPIVSKEYDDVVDFLKKQDEELEYWDRERRSKLGSESTQPEVSTVSAAPSSG